MLGNNIKVHFAGMEQILIAQCAIAANVKYSLFTVFPFIAEKFGIKSFNILGAKDMGEKIKILKKQNAQCKHVIMDSGLFTLMFGAAKGKRDGMFIDAWVEALAAFVVENELNVTCVEVDCQKILGVEESWQLRQRMRDILPTKNRMINVFHVEDGRKGLDRIVEYSEYMAISVPELRLVYGTGAKYEDVVIRIANYVKNKKPDIDIHLLGCTCDRLLRELRFCTSADSTSWISVNRFGEFSIDGEKINWRNVKQSKIGVFEKKIKENFDENGFDSKKYDFYARFYLNAIACKQHYARIAGGQE